MLEIFSLEFNEVKILAIVLLSLGLQLAESSCTIGHVGLKTCQNLFQGNSQVLLFCFLFSLSEVFFGITKNLEIVFNHFLSAF